MSTIKPVPCIKKINKVNFDFMLTFKEYYALKVHYATFCGLKTNLHVFCEKNIGLVVLRLRVTVQTFFFFFF